MGIGQASINPRNFETSEGCVRFFDVTATWLKDDLWESTIGDGHYGSIFIPKSIMYIVRECITSDVESGKINLTAQLQLSPWNAIKFYIEGVLTDDHLVKAVETEDTIDIPGVRIEDRTLTVRVVRNPIYAVATADREGNLL